MFGFGFGFGFAGSLFFMDVTKENAKDVQGEFLLNPVLVKAKFGILEAELSALRKFGELHHDKIEGFIAEFYQWMYTLPEFNIFFTNAPLVEHVKQKQILYWKEFFSANITDVYLTNRERIGVIHAKIGLPIHSYCAAMTYSFVWWTKKIEAFRKDAAGSKEGSGFFSEIIIAFQKLIQLDIAIITHTYHKYTEKTWKDIASETQSIIEDMSRVTKAVVNGDYSMRLQADADKPLNISINQMIENLDKSDKENKRETWIKTGQTELADQLRGDQDLVKSADTMIHFLTTYLGASVGVFYLVTAAQELQLIASYAYTHRKNLSNKFKPGEGLIGQALLEKKILVVDDLPEDYLLVGSGLGSAASKSILIVPIMMDGKVFAVMELATLKEFTELHIDFITIIAESLAVTLESAQARSKMQELLQDSEEKSKVLEAQKKQMLTINKDLEEKALELKSSEEELKTQSEQLQASNEELEEKTQLLEEQKRNIERKNLELEASKKQLEEKAEELQTSGKYKSEFLSNMSHELRTPLNSLLILAQNLSANEEENLTEDQVKASQIIYNSGRDLLNLINDILDLSKVESGKLLIELEELNLQHVLDTCYEKIKPLAEQKKIDFSFQKTGTLPEIFIGDELRIEQILKNLLSNAIKFTESKGKVTLNVYIPEKSEVEAQSLKTEKIIAFAITDTGIGIDKKNKKIVFEAFKQSDGSISRKHGGTGLGLTISQQLAHILGGKVGLESELGKGSTFTLYLPIEENVKKSKNKTGSAKQNQKISLSNKKRERRTTPLILLIEDDKNFLNIMEKSLNHRGFLSLVASDGETGLKYAKEQLPDAIILDVGLPDIGGLSVLDALKADPETKNIPIHIVSGADVKRPALEKGALGYIQKPLDKTKLDLLINKASEVLDEPVQNILLVEDEDIQREAICKLLNSDNLSITLAKTGKEAEKQLRKARFHCMILDLKLPDMLGEELLEKISGDPAIILPPVIIHTARDLSEEEQKRLSTYTPTIILKTADAPERLTEEVALFLHKITEEKTFSSQSSSDVFTGKKILLVDDDMRNNIALGATLRKQGMQVITADNGEMALECLEKNDVVHMVLMDIMMPVMDGYTAMKKIREDQQLKDIPIIALTAKAMVGDKEKCIEAGANEYLAKPIDLEKLFTLMKVWIH